MAASDISLVVCGAAGRMGRRLVQAALDTPGLALAGALEAPGSPHVGKDAGALLGLALGVPIVDSTAKLPAHVEALVDFTVPAATLAALRHARAVGAAMVIGTTGFEKAGEAEIEKAAGEIAIVKASNMSVGMNVVFKVAAEVARALGEDYDVEIVEMHHRLKKDAPSGTAMTLAASVAKALGRDLGEVASYGRHGIVGERPRKEIGVMTLRGGDVVGDHTAIFAGPGERVEITHRAASRDNFARGAMRAALWLKDRAPGLYDMQDVLGLR